MASADSVTRIAIVGSSFIRRIKDDIKSKDIPEFQHNFGFPTDIHTSFVFRGGWTVRDVTNALPHIKEHCPHAVILQIGSNDLTETGADGDMVASRVLQLAAGILIETGASIVGVCPCFPRKKGKYMKTKDSVYTYNALARQFNRFLFRHTTKTPGLHFWPHYGLDDNTLWQNRHILLRKDGVHLSDKGQGRFYASLSRAVGSLYAALQVRPSICCHLVCCISFPVVISTQALYTTRY